VNLLVKKNTPVTFQVSDAADAVELSKTALGVPAQGTPTTPSPPKQSTPIPRAVPVGPMPSPTPSPAKSKTGGGFGTRSKSPSPTPSVRNPFRP
jgi:hypothetical protein